MTVTNSLKERAKSLGIPATELVKRDLADLNLPVIVYGLVAFDATHFDIGGIAALKYRLIHALAREAVWDYFFGDSDPFTIPPVMFDEDGRPLDDERLFAEMKRAFAKAIISDSFLMNRAKFLLAQEREKLRTQGEAVEGECCSSGSFKVSGEATVEFETN